MAPWPRQPVKHYDSALINASWVLLIIGKPARNHLTFFFGTLEACLGD